MNYQFRRAELTELEQIWEILQQAIQRRKQNGSNQWQDGYPNPEVIHNDVEKGSGFVLVGNEKVIGYTALLISDEPAYDSIEGKWLTNDGFVVLHRVAIAEEYLGKGLAKRIMKEAENFALSNDIYSIKADTNFDNFAMIKIFESLGYSYCGEVHFRGSPRKAYEKVLEKLL